jgi:hypothetical protein
VKKSCLTTRSTAGDVWVSQFEGLEHQTLRSNPLCTGWCPNPLSLSEKNF